MDTVWCYLSTAQQWTCLPPIMDDF
ncbi:hypothetical protein [Sulfurospirillum halorespirans]